MISFCDLSCSTELYKMKNDKQYKLDERYLRMAHIWAENSYCKRRKVGAVIVKDKMIISDGYNGTPEGLRIFVKRKII